MFDDEEVLKIMKKYYDMQYDYPSLDTCVAINMKFCINEFNNQENF